MVATPQLRAVLAATLLLAVGCLRTGWQVFTLADSTDVRGLEGEWVMAHPATPGDASAGYLVSRNRDGSFRLRGRSGTDSGRTVIVVRFAPSLYVVQLQEGAGWVLMTFRFDGQRIQRLKESRDRARIETVASRHGFRIVWQLLGNRLEPTRQVTKTDVLGLLAEAHAAGLFVAEPSALFVRAGAVVTQGVPRPARDASGQVDRNIAETRQSLREYDETLRRRTEALDARKARLDSNAWKTPAGQPLFPDAQKRWFYGDGTAVPSSVVRDRIAPDHYELRFAIASIRSGEASRVALSMLGAESRSASIATLARQAWLFEQVEPHTPLARREIARYGQRLRDCYEKSTRLSQYVCYQVMTEVVERDWNCREKRDWFTCFREANAVIYLLGKRLRWDPDAALRRMEENRRAKGQTGAFFIL
jgi:hypothetical protein